MLMSSGSGLGAKGEKGDKGDIGPQGIQGLKGDKGDIGAQGIKGDTGSQGPQGVQGLKGDKGDTGTQGIQGIQGIQGVPGAQGAQGLQGNSVVWRGAYSGNTSYVPLNTVSYNGSSYICKQNSTGNLPTNTTYWDLMVTDLGGTVTGVSIVSANGISGSVSNPSTNPAITLSLGNITPTSVNGLIITQSDSKTLSVPQDASIQGVNTGDETIDRIENLIYLNTSGASDLDLFDYIMCQRNASPYHIVELSYTSFRALLKTYFDSIYNQINNQRSPSKNVAVESDSFLYISNDYEIRSGYTTELALNGILEIS